MFHYSPTMGKESLRFQLVVTALNFNSEEGLVVAAIIYVFIYVYVSGAGRRLGIVNEKYYKKFKNFYCNILTVKRFSIISFKRCNTGNTIVTMLSRMKFRNCFKTVLLFLLEKETDV
ncbi:unnamed protein product, partial [Leptidea sinapis]